MQLFVGGRRTGKTTGMVDWLLQGAWSRVLIVATETDVTFIRELINLRKPWLLGNQFPGQILTCRQLIDDRRTFPMDTVFGMDDVECCLVELFLVVVSVGSITVEDPDLGETVARLDSEHNAVVDLLRTLRGIRNRRIEL